MTLDTRTKWKYADMWRRKHEVFSYLTSSGVKIACDSLRVIFWSPLCVFWPRAKAACFFLFYIGQMSVFHMKFRRIRKKWPFGLPLRIIVNLYRGFSYFLVMDFFGCKLKYAHSMYCSIIRMVKSIIDFLLSLCVQIWSSVHIFHRWINTWLFLGGLAQWDLSFTFLSFFLWQKVPSPPLYSSSSSSSPTQWAKMEMDDEEGTAYSTHH